MRFAIFIALCFAVVSFSAYTTEEDVVVLTDSNFDDALKEFDYALVEFYAPWCGHCKALAPNYAAAAKQLAESNPEIKLCKLDATVETGVAGKFSVTGFPTLKFFTKGSSTSVEYEGGRSTSDIVNWLKKKTGPASVEVKSIDDAEKAIGDSDVVVIFFGPASSEAFANYMTVAQTFDGVAFAHTNNQAIKDKFKATGETTLVLFKKFDEGKNVHTGSFETQTIREFINANRLPTVLPFDQDAAEKIFGEGLEVLIVFTNNDDAGNKAFEALKKASSKLKGKIVMAHARMGEGIADRVADFIGVQKDTLPAVRIVEAGKNNQKYPMEGEITAENLKKFAQDFKDGKLKPFFKSAPIPESSHEDGVRVLVGKNWKDVVLDEKNDVLVEYYAPWCGHCQSLAPKYSALANKLKDVSGIVIAKMDATANEVEGLSVKSFPTIKFYPRGSKSSPLDFKGERTEAGLMEYLRQNSKAKLPEPTAEDIAAAKAAASGYATEDGVIVLTDSNFWKAIKEFDFALVEFYAPWCGHCKALAPNYAAAAKELAQSNPEIKLCKVDATAEKEAASNFQIPGFPTMMFFAKGKGTPTEYGGGRETSEIVSWLKQKIGSASVELNSVAAAEKLISDKDVVAIFFGPADSEAFANYMSTAHAFDDVAFAHTNEQSIRDKFKVTGDTTLVLFNKFDDGKYVHTGSFEAQTLRDFVNANRFPTIFAFDENAKKKIIDAGLEALIVLTNNDDAGNKAFEALKEISSELKGKIVMAHARMGEGDGDKLAHYISVPKNTLPAVRIVQFSNNQKYIMEDRITASNLRNFVQDFKDSKLKPHFKSEHVPFHTHDDGVRVVVGKNWKDIVLDENNDVLVEYYAPWCGHCQNLAPIYSTLARRLRDVSGLVIAHMDGTKNEVEGLNVQGYPTIQFYPRGNKSSPLYFNGDRTEEGFMDFLRKNSKASLPQDKLEDWEL